MRKFIVVASVFVSTIACADPTTFMTLHDAVMLALRYNPNIVNREIGRITDKYKLRVANNEFELRYALSGSVSASRARSMGITGRAVSSYDAVPELKYKTIFGTEMDVKMNNNSNGTQYRPTVTASVSQPLLRGSGIDVVTRSRSDTYDNEISNKLDLKQTVIDNLIKVMRDYREAIKSNNDVKISRGQLVEAKKNVKFTQARIDAGELEPTAIIETEAQVETLKLRLTQSKNSAQQNKQTLLADIGLDPEKKITLPSDVNLEKMQLPNVDEFVNTALHHNTSYLRSLISLRQTERALKVQENEQEWDLRVTGTFVAGGSGGIRRGDTNIENIVSGRNSSHSIKAELTIPIDDVSRKQGLVDAKVNLDKQKITLDAAKRQLITDVKNKITDIKAQYQSVRIAAKNVKLKQNSYDVERQKQAAGLSSAINVSTAQDRLVLAQNSLINSKIAYLNAVMDLNNISGVMLKVWGIKVKY